MEGNDVKEEVGSIEKKIVCVFLMILYFIEEYLIMNFEDEFLFIKYMYKEEYFLKINKFQFMLELNNGNDVLKGLVIVKIFEINVFGVL